MLDRVRTAGHRAGRPARDHCVVGAPAAGDRGRSGVVRRGLRADGGSGATAPCGGAPRLGHGLGVLYAEAAEVFLAHLRAPKRETVPALLGIAERAESVPYVFHAARLRRFAVKIMLTMGTRRVPSATTDSRTRRFSV